MRMCPRRDRIGHDDIGFVEPGQPVKLKLAAYPFQKYGVLEGTMKTIAADVSSANTATQKRLHRLISASRQHATVNS